MGKYSCPPLIFQISVLFLLQLTTFSYSQKIGGAFGYHFTKWDIFEHCYDFEAYGEIPLFKSRFFLIPTASIRLLTHNQVTGDSVQSTHEKFTNVLSVYSFGAGYSICSISPFSLKTALQIGCIPLFPEYSIFKPDSVILPGEIRFAANLMLDLEITLSSHLGLDIFPVLGYVTQSGLQEYKTRFRGWRPFDSYTMFQCQVGIFYRFGSYHKDKNIHSDKSE